ncbi:High mobility group protein B2 [Sciurus carolinensis]|uniref:High mobility group protein B2 n=1 Tax=Sciurus carolinensis TaxID=30640 RepID=A0AA41MLP2_SCICA|nr:High mobility group protein B2 [Sciurus carolinensis]
MGKGDPNKPRGKMSSYAFFVQEEHKKKHPDSSVNFAEFSKKCSERWKKLGEMWSEQSAKDKQPYEQKAAKQKEKYEKDNAAYHAKGKSEAGKKGPGRPTGSKKKSEPEDEEEEEEEEEEDEE